MIVFLGRIPNALLDPASVTKIIQILLDSAKICPCLADANLYGFTFLANISLYVVQASNKHDLIADRIKVFGLSNVIF